jgi:hypothetical protein
MYAALTGNANFTAYMTHIASTVSLLRVELQDIRQAQQAIVASTGASVPGTAAGAEMPDEVALAVTLRAAGIGPSNRGRIYFLGFDTAEMAPGNVASPALITALGNLMNFAIPAMFSAGGLSQGIINPARQAYTGATGTAHPARAAVIKPVASQLVRDNHWDSQRRRGLK